MARNAAKLIENVVCAVARDIIASDRLVALDNLPSSRKITSSAHVTVVTKASAEVRFVSYKQQDASLAFRLFGSRSAGIKVADIWVSLTILPAVEESKYRNIDATFYHLPPGFLAPSSARDWLSIRLSASRMLYVQEELDGRLTYRSSDTRLLVGPDFEWTVNLHVELLRTLAAWVKAPSFLDARPLRLTDGILFHLLRSVGATYHSIAQCVYRPHVRTDLTPSVASLPGVAALIGTGHYLDRLRSTIRVHLNKQGELVEGPDERGQQFDVNASMRSDAQGNGINIEICIPDFLVEGDLYTDLLRALTEHLREADDLPLAREDLIRLVDSASRSGRAAVARIQKAETDVDVVLIEGTRGGVSVALLYEIVVEIEQGLRPVVKRILKAELIVCRNGEDWMLGNGNATKLKQYFERLFRTFLTWQRLQEIG